jgi:hypothetical protein
MLFVGLPQQDLYFAKEGVNEGSNHNEFMVDTHAKLIFTATHRQIIRLNSAS